jgi:DNA repair exonuclease SbcCD ATPase subunit
MKQTLFLIALSLCLYSCGSSSCDDLQAEVKRLKAELDNRNTVYLSLDRLMQEADKSLSSIQTEQSEIDSLLQAPGALKNKKLILEKIEAMQKFSEESREKITKLETQLTQAKAQGQETEGLRRIIAQLRNELDAKDKMIVSLNDKVGNLEGNLLALRSEVNTKENVIRNQKSAIQEVTADKEDAIKLQEQETLRRQAAELEKKISNLIKDGEKDELEGDKTKLAPNKKAQHYVDAYNRYKQARQLYIDNPRVSSYMNYSKSEIENKLREVKAKAPKKAQEQMN